MATQRAPPRRPVHPATQGAMQNLRESSRSPAFKSRPVKMQIYAGQPQPPQSSPTSSITSRRSPPATLAVQRLLPTPPRPAADDGPGSPSYPRRHAYPDNWQVTDELLAEIERADLQQAYLQPTSPPMDRLRAPDRSSPKDPADVTPQQRRSQVARDSPQRTSPAEQTPERRASPAEHPAVYAQYARRPTNAAPGPTSASAPVPPSVPAPVPVLASLAARTPDRSLPVQEIEDEPAKNGTGTGTGTGPGTRTQAWQEINDAQQQHVRHTPENAASLPETAPTGEREEFTPRSPTAELPDDSSGKYYSPRRPRNGTTDELGLRSFDPAEFEGDTSVLVMGSEMPPQYSEPRRQQQMQTHQQYPYAEYDSSYLQAYYQSPRPGAPVPPTPQTHTAAPSPSPLLPPFSPVPPPGSPYPHPFSHVRRPAGLTGIQAQLARQWEVYARNHQYGTLSDSTFSPAVTPFEGARGGHGHGGSGGADFAPWAAHHTTRTLGRPPDTTSASIRSSPSHEPLEPPTLPPALGIKAARRAKREREHGHGLPRRMVPPRVDSTQPRDTSPELSSSSGEETAGEDRFTGAGAGASGNGTAEDGNWSGGTIAPPTSAGGGGDEKDEWVDEEEDDDDLLELEYHQNFVSNLEKRRRRWEVGWEAVTQAIQTLDRQTDATIILLAAPSHTTKLHAATSRSVRRQCDANTMKELRGAFSRIAAARRRSRAQTHKASLVDRFLCSASSGYSLSLNSTGSGSGSGSGTGTGTGSDGSTSTSTSASAADREGDLKRALEAALGSLASLGGIYERREARWKEEMCRVAEDRERVEVLLGQVLGGRRSLAGLGLGLGGGAGAVSGQGVGMGGQAGQGRS